MRLRAIPAMVSMIPAVVQGLKVNDLERITEIVRRTYPDVPQVGTELLEGWMEGSDSLFLVDVRSREEFDVSHLRSAVNLQSAKEIGEASKSGTLPRRFSIARWVFALREWRTFF